MLKVFDNWTSEDRRSASDLASQTGSEELLLSESKFTTRRLRGSYAFWQVMMRTWIY